MQFVTQSSLTPYKPHCEDIYPNLTKAKITLATGEALFSLFGC
ncbi:hypothetical protein RLOC_00009705 [Lonchura striata]|uniref:Uncharacterized protein n=1 Tax=Lonchura striata TaxID=40157 RepID=A0A218VD40_9PASE|nr:hypothetical protein RLOC_00009705 [Lonchura striata domestica]